MDDLDRLLQTLVEVIREGQPERLRAPFQVSELYQKIIPYRGFKKRLGFDTSEDYDMAVLRLLAGERGYASVEPEEVMEQLTLEAEAINPTPGFYREFAAASVTLNASAIRPTTSDREAYAPPESEQSPPSIPTRQGPVAEGAATGSRTPVFEAVESASAGLAGVGEPRARSCANCTSALPTHRPLQFCPFCGARLTSLSCRGCGADIEPGWQFCGTCGAAVPGDAKS